MRDIVRGRYPLAEPGCGLTVLSMEGGEITLFGSCVKIKTTGKDSYDTIEDAPESRPVVDQADANLWNGLKVSSFFAVLGSVALFGATIATGGTALILLGGACIAGGASISTGVYSVSSYGKDKLTGSYTSESDFNAGLSESAFRGASAGATVFGIAVCPPAGAAAAQLAGGGTAAAASAGVVDTLVSVIPQIIGIEAAAEMLAQAGKAMLSKPPDGGDAAGGEEEGVYIENGESKGVKGLVGKEFEEYLTDTIGGEGSFKIDGREFDGGIGNRWWEAKSGNYWELLQKNPAALNKFKSDMGHRLRIATQNGATYELFSNTPIPESIKQWLLDKGIYFTELIN